jgi:predicted transposase YbfD/YdcC
MFLVIAASICGESDWVSVENFGNGQLEWLRNFFPFKNGIPSHDTMGRVFARVDTDQFNMCFINWINKISKLTDGEVVAIDGKCMRGSYDNADSQAAIHIVSAYAAENHLCLGQVVTDKKSNEITAIPKLLKILNLEGCTVTIDAMGCQKSIAQDILDKKAEYILGLKENQKGLLEQVESLFKVTVPASEETNRNIDHGRTETRKCTVLQDLRFLDEKKNWPGLKSVIKIDSERHFKVSGKTEKATRYYISSLKVDALLINDKIRDHWAVENKLHWVLDVVFNEDASRKRKGNSPANSNIISKFALTLLEINNSKIPKTQKRKKAAYKPDFRKKMLGF